MRLGLLQQTLFAVLAHLLFQRPQLHQHFALNFGGGHIHMHRHRFLVQALETGLVAQGRKIFTAGAGQCGLQQGRIGEKLGKISTFKGAARHAQMLLQCSIGVKQGSIDPQYRYQ